MQAPAIRLKGLVRIFGEVRAVDGVDLEIAAGDFFSMLGPSGSGKTTVLRMIAGFEKPTSGTVELFGEDVTTLPPFDREVTTVFQDYALFPHMSVLENIEYGLRVRGIDKSERKNRVAEVLSMVRLEGFEDRRPSQLSGGQRQRVALARAIVVRPKVLLLDEPLGALDLKLREQMQVELKQIQRELGITFIFVTHDQAEALSLSDKVAVFNKGKIVQLGTPEEIYNQPKDQFVADFVGSSNLFEPDVANQLFGLNAPLLIRPEHVLLEAKSTSKLQGTIEEIIFLGNMSRILVKTDSGHQIFATETNDGGHGQRKRGQPVGISVESKYLTKLIQK